MGTRAERVDGHFTNLWQGLKHRVLCPPKHKRGRQEQRAPVDPVWKISVRDDVGTGLMNHLDQYTENPSSSTSAQLKKSRILTNGTMLLAQTIKDESTIDINGTITDTPGKYRK